MQRLRGILVVALAAIFSCAAQERAQTSVSPATPFESVAVAEPLRPLVSVPDFFRRVPVAPTTLELLRWYPPRFVDFVLPTGTEPYHDLMGLKPPWTRPVYGTPEDTSDTFFRGTILEEGQPVPPGTKGPVWIEVLSPLEQYRRTGLELDRMYAAANQLEFRRTVLSKEQLAKDAEERSRRKALRNRFFYGWLILGVTLFSGICLYALRERWGLSDALMELVRTIRGSQRLTSAPLTAEEIERQRARFRRVQEEPKSA